MKDNDKFPSFDTSEGLLRTFPTHCPFGCPTFGFSQQQLRDHRSNDYLHHLDIFYARIKELGLDNDFYIDGDNKSYLSSLVKNEMENEVQDIKNLVEKGKYSQKKGILKRKERKEQMKLLEKGIEETSLTSFNASLTWIIPPEKRDMEILRSAVFYTGKYGYKMRLQLKKDTAKTMDQELSLVFLKGIYDPVLRGEFITKVTIKLRLVGKEEEDISPTNPITLRRSNNTEMEQLNKILTLPPGTVDSIKFKIDCSEFDLSSID